MHSEISNNINAPAPLEAVVFDLDDTLISWEKADHSWAGVVKNASADIPDYLRKHNLITVSDDDYFEEFRHEMIASWSLAHNENTGVSFAGVLMRTLERLGAEADSADIQAIMRLFDWQPAPGVAAFPDAVPVLKALRQRGLKIGLITNAWQPMWMRQIEMETFGLSGHFDAEITSGDTGYIKPHPAVFWRMLGLLNTLPERAIMVGDSPTADMRGGNYVGMTTVQMKPPHVNRNQHDVIPNHQIAALSELLPIVDEWLSQ